jgi:hypothetical protein
MLQDRFMRFCVIEYACPLKVLQPRSGFNLIANKNLVIKAIHPASLLPATWRLCEFQKYLRPFILISL